MPNDHEARAEGEGAMEKDEFRSQDRSKNRGKEALHSLVDLLSDYECKHLYSAVNGVVAGERFWEHDAGLFYNEYVKTRYSYYVRNPGAFIGGGEYRSE